MKNQQNLELTFSNAPIITSQPTSAVNEEISTVTTQPPTAAKAAIYGILSQDFVQLLKDGEYSDTFSFNGKEITHDPQKMKFFTKAKHLHGTPFPTAESCDIVCHTVQDLRNLKESLLNKHFMFKAKMFVVECEWSGIQSRINRSGVFTVDPKHPDIAERLITAFEKVEQYAEQGLKYELQLNFNISVAAWYEDFALTYRLADEIRTPGTRVFAVLSITNASHAVQWCGECSQPRFFAMGCLCVLPFWVPCCCIEYTYRKCAYKKHIEAIDCVVATI